MLVRTSTAKRLTVLDQLKEAMMTHVSIGELPGNPRPLMGHHPNMTTDC
jgi:hypothetical protein